MGDHKWCAFERPDYYLSGSFDSREDAIHEAECTYEPGVSYVVAPAVFADVAAMATAACTLDDLLDAIQGRDGLCEDEEVECHPSEDEARAAWEKLVADFARAHLSFVLGSFHAGEPQEERCAGAEGEEVGHG